MLSQAMRLHLWVAASSVGLAAAVWSHAQIRVRSELDGACPFRVPISVLTKESDSDPAPSEGL